MGKIRTMLWLMTIMIFISCAASRKVEFGNHEERRDSTVFAATDSVKKSDVKTDSTARFATDESHASGTMSEKGRGEETVTERVTESTDAQGNKTTTTDRTIHRTGSYEHSSSYEQRIKHQEEMITRMQHTIDSLMLSNRANVGTHWAKKDSTNVVKEKNTKDIKTRTNGFVIFMISAFVIFCFLVNLVGPDKKYILWERRKMT